MACFNASLFRSKRPGKLSADTGSAYMIWSQHPTRNKATSRRSGLWPGPRAPLPHNPDIPIAVWRECPLAYRGNRPGIHSHHGRLVPSTVGEKGDNQALRNTCHIYDNQALALHPLSVCSQGLGHQQGRKCRGSGHPQMGPLLGQPRRPRDDRRLAGCRPAQASDRRSRRLWPNAPHRASARQSNPRPETRHPSRLIR